MEAQVIHRLFRHCPTPPAVSSLKGGVGHTLGAAGAIESVLSVMALHEVEMCFLSNKAYHPLAVPFLFFLYNRNNYKNNYKLINSICNNNKIINLILYCSWRQ